MATYKKKAAGRIAAVLMTAVLLCGCAETPSLKPVESTPEDAAAAWEEARTTPLGRYPELVTYTLGKVISENNSNMPEGDTYEDNNYTRYIRGILNVQNEDVMEAQEHGQYEQVEVMAVMEGKIPDIMIVTDDEILDQLVEHDMIQDLTEVYENCTSDRIKEMYDSFGEDKLGAVTYGGKLMAFPETEIYTGPSLLWLRKDWIDDLGLAEPETMEEAMDIILAYKHRNPGAHKEGNVGLVFDPSMVGKTDQCFSIEPLFDECHAYPGKWLKDKNGRMVYGSVTEEMKEALRYIRQLYREGVLDQNFMIRNAKNLPQLLETGRCGAFFGWWWAPNDPLSPIYDEEAEWKPYLFPDENNAIETSLSYGRDYCVVARKGFEYPEIIPKVLSALFDYARYDGKEDAEGVGQYLGMNVNPAATPLVINVDYSDAIFRARDSIQSVLDGKRKFSEMTVLEQGYYNSCKEYLETEKKTEGYQWAAYASRIEAVSRLATADITYVNEGYTQAYDKLLDAELYKLEEETFITIITGEKPLEEFDRFVETWYKEGGRKLTEEANKEMRNGY